MAQVSVFIPVYNMAPFLAQAVESVIRQTYVDWELLIVDDCSTDTSFEIAQWYAKQYPVKISALRNDQNLGMLVNWNRGISLCKGPYFVKLDADDIWHPEMLQSAIRVLEARPEVGLIFTKYLHIDKQGAIVPSSEIVLPEFARDKAFSCIPLVKMGVDRMLSYSILRQGLSVMRRKIFEEIGSYSYLETQDTMASTDTEFYFRLGLHYQIYCIDQAYYCYRIHTDSISATDKSAGLASLKLYEVKKAILSYYHQHGEVSVRDFDWGLKKIRFDLERDKIYRTVDRSFLKRARQILRTFGVSPLLFVKFYGKRIAEKRRKHRA